MSDIGWQKSRNVPLAVPTIILAIANKISLQFDFAQQLISLLTIELVIPWAQSLKDRRSAVRGLKDRLRSRFNVSVRR